MQFVPSCHDDISRYFRGTFVKFQEYGDKLFYIRDVHSREISGTTEDHQEFRLYMKEDMPYNVEFLLPRKSFFQMDRHAVLLSRIPAKQYRRGICRENTSIASLDVSGMFQMEEVGFSSLRAYVNKQEFPSLNVAVANKEKNHSIALSPRMAYVSRTRTLFIDDLPVAHLDTKAKQCTILQPIYRDEVLEIVKGSVFEGNVK